MLGYLERPVSRDRKTMVTTMTLFIPDLLKYDTLASCPRLAQHFVARNNKF